MKVTLKNKILALAFAVVTLGPTPYAHAFSITETAGDVWNAASSGAGALASGANELYGSYQGLLEDFQSGACRASGAMGNSSLYAGVMGAAQDKIGELGSKAASKLGGSLGGDFANKVVQGQLNEMRDAAISRHTCVIKERSEAMETALKGSYTRYKSNANTDPQGDRTLTDMLADAAGDAAGDYLNDKLGDTFIGEHVDFNNVTDQGVDCMSGEQSTACGTGG